MKILIIGCLGAVAALAQQVGPGALMPDTLAFLQGRAPLANPDFTGKVTVGGASCPGGSPAGSICAVKMYGDGSAMTGLAGGGDMSAATYVTSGAGAPSNPCATEGVQYYNTTPSPNTAYLCPSAGGNWLGPVAAGTFAPLASPTFTGTPAAPTAAADTNTTQVATTGFYAGQKGTANPAMDGSAAAGTSLKFSPIDHVHPVDTSRAAAASYTNVTNDVQTKAAVVPNTAPAAGQVPCGNAGNTAYAPCTISGDGTLASTGALTITKVNNVSVSAASSASTIVQRNASSEVIAANTVPTGRTATYTLASGATAMTTGALAANTCASATTVSATGVLTTDVIAFTPSTDVSAAVGYGPASTDGLKVYPYPTADNVNFKVCNGTGSSITAPPMTLNWRVAR